MTPPPPNLISNPPRDVLNARGDNVPDSTNLRGDGKAGVSEKIEALLRFSSGEYVHVEKRWLLDVIDEFNRLHDQVRDIAVGATTVSVERDRLRYENEQLRSLLVKAQDDFSWLDEENDQLREKLARIRRGFMLLKAMDTKCDIEDLSERELAFIENVMVAIEKEVDEQ